jgi:hypothetical protein
MLDRRALILSALALAAPSAAASQALRPTEKVWKPAKTPPGGVPWSLLESTKELTRTDAQGFIHSTPAFAPGVKALEGKTVKVAGYMTPLQNGALQKHFVLMAYPPDCPFHLNPKPMQFMEVKSEDGVGFEYKVKNIAGILQLGGLDDSGIFYRLIDAYSI